MEESYYLSIVVPAYKEEDRIPVMMDAIEKYVKSKDFPIETIILVDASPDNTAGVAKGYADRIPNLRVIVGRVNRGKGGAVKHGIMEARGKYIVFADADNSTPIEQVDKLLKHVSRHEVVIGSR
ncbi:MAG TPA: glycosyltransferase, partial [bacterium]|nr:glycosyltransferase [bacterium]